MLLFANASSHCTNNCIFLTFRITTQKHALVMSNTFRIIKIFFDAIN